MNKNFKPVPVASDRLNSWGRVSLLKAHVLDYETRINLDRAKDKPARVLPRRDSGYLIELANGAFTNKQGQIFYNPSDRQLDKIFDGELYGHR